MQVMVGGCAQSTRDAKAPQLIAILVPSGHGRGVDSVQKANVIDVNLIWGNTDDWAYNRQWGSHMKQSLTYHIVYADPVS